MSFILRFLFFSLLSLFVFTASGYGEGKKSGLDIPRFISMAASEANMRTGPGSHYPIEWVYKRPGLPLKVIEDYDNWRRVVDNDGVTGWFHVSLLSGRRMAQITQGPINLYKEPDSLSETVIKAEEGVIGDLLSCDEIWCRMKIQGRKGWLKRGQIYGILSGENLN